MGTDGRSLTGEKSAVESLRRSLIEEIDSGSLAPGVKLGNERDLAVTHGVSRGTLRQALTLLEQAGLIRRVPGRGGGTFVSHAKVERDISVSSSVPSVLASQGYTSDTKVISTRIALPKPGIRSDLQLGDGDLVVEIRRIRLANRTPISLEQAVFPESRFPGLLEQPLGGSLYELLDNIYETQPCETEERVEVVSATDEEASFLTVEAQAPLILIRRVSYDTNGRPFEASKDLFRGDRTRIRMRAPGGGIRTRAVQDGDILEFRSTNRASVV